MPSGSGRLEAQSIQALEFALVPILPPWFIVSATSSNLKTSSSGSPTGVSSPTLAWTAKNEGSWSSQVAEAIGSTLASTMPMLMPLASSPIASVERSLSSRIASDPVLKDVPSVPRLVGVVADEDRGDRDPDQGGDDRDVPDRRAVGGGLGAASVGVGGRGRARVDQRGVRGAARRPGRTCGCRRRLATTLLEGEAALDEDEVGDRRW